MKKGRRKLSAETKIEALRLSEERGVRAAAEALGIGKETIYRWRRELESSGLDAFRGHGNRTALDEENRQLRAENRRLREEAEILKKAAAYFAKHTR